MVKYSAIAAGVAVVAFVLYKGAAKTAAAAKTLVTETLNPASDKNAAYGAANAVTQAISGDPNATVGTKLWDVFNRDKDRQISDMLNPPPQASYDETDRLAKRYPAPPEAPVEHYDPFGTYLGLW